ATPVSNTARGVIPHGRSRERLLLLERVEPLLGRAVGIPARLLARAVLPEELLAQDRVEGRVEERAVDPLAPSRLEHGADELLRPRGRQAHDEPPDPDRQRPRLTVDALRRLGTGEHLEDAGADAVGPGAREQLDDARGRRLAALVLDARVDPDRE